MTEGDDGLIPIEESGDKTELPYDASDPNAVRDRKRRSKTAEKEDQEFVAAAMTTVEGRRFFWRRLTDAHIFSTTFDPVNMHNTAFNEGQRNQGLKLMALILRAAPEEYILMVKEQENG